jgi:hypothetical protein
MSWDEGLLYKVRTATTVPPLEFNVFTTGRPREFSIFMYPFTSLSTQTYKVEFTIPEEIACGFLGGVDNMVDYQVQQALFDLHKQSGWSF